MVDGRLGHERGFTRLERVILPSTGEPEYPLGPHAFGIVPDDTRLSAGPVGVVPIEVPPDPTVLPVQVDGRVAIVVDLEVLSAGVIPAAGLKGRRVVQVDLAEDKRAPVVGSHGDALDARRG